MSNKKAVILVVSVLIIIFFVILGMRFFSGEDDWICQNGQWVKHENHSAPAPTTGCGEIAKKAANQAQKTEADNQEKKAETGNNAEEKNIIVDFPKANEAVGLPITIKGKARVFENTFNYRIKDSDDRILLENYITVEGADIGEFGPFEASFNYLEPKGKEGKIEVFEYSAKDGSEINEVEIPVIFKKVESTNVKVFFGNRKEDPDAQNCGEVYEASRRIPKVSGVAKESLLELIRGTYATEEDDGYFSQISRDAKANKITIAGGIARVDFSHELVDGAGGSCEKEIIKAQITQTLKQFPTVKNIEITVDGKEGVL